MLIISIFPFLRFPIHSLRSMSPLPWVYNCLTDYLSILLCLRLLVSYSPHRIQSQRRRLLRYYLLLLACLLIVFNRVDLWNELSKHLIVLNRELSIHEIVPIYHKGRSLCLCTTILILQLMQCIWCVVVIIHLNFWNKIFTLTIAVAILGVVYIILSTLKQLLSSKLLLRYSLQWIKNLL